MPCFLNNSRYLDTFFGGRREFLIALPKTMYFECARFKTKANPWIDWTGLEGTAGWSAIFTHFRKLYLPPLMYSKIRGYGREVF
jgi:hypothetical protein